MIKVFIYSLIFSSFLQSFEDMGTYGETSIIAERNFMDIVEEKSKDLNTTLLEKQFHEGRKSFMKVKRLLPTCSATRQRKYRPFFIVPADVVLPNGKVLAIAGEKKYTLDVMGEKGMRLDKYMMFIDVDDAIQVQLSYRYKNNGFVFITNGDIKGYEQYTKIQAFKGEKETIAKFGIECSPSFAIQYENELLIYEYNPRELEMSQK